VELGIEIVCSLKVLHSCVFCDAESALSAIDKFLVHLLMEGKGGVEGRRT